MHLVYNLCIIGSAKTQPSECENVCMPTRNNFWVNSSKLILQVFGMTFHYWWKMIVILIWRPNNGLCHGENLAHGYSFFSQECSILMIKFTSIRQYRIYVLPIWERVERKATKSQLQYSAPFEIRNYHHAFTIEQGNSS